MQIQGKMKKTRIACSTLDYPTGAMMVQTVPAFLDIDIVTICPISFSIQEWFDVILFAKLYLSNLNFLNCNSFLSMIGKAAVVQVCMHSDHPPQHI